MKIAINNIQFHKDLLEIEPFLKDVRILNTSQSLHFGLNEVILLSDKRVTIRDTDLLFDIFLTINR